MGFLSGLASRMLKKDIEQLERHTIVLQQEAVVQRRALLEQAETISTLKAENAALQTQTSEIKLSLAETNTRVNILDGGCNKLALNVVELEEELAGIEAKMMDKCEKQTIKQSNRSKTTLSLSLRGTYLVYLLNMTFTRLGDVIRLQTWSYPAGDQILYQKQNGETMTEIMVHITHTPKAHLGASYHSAAWKVENSPRAAIVGALREMKMPGKDDECTKKLPKFVYELGEVFVREKSLDGKFLTELESTRYHAVIDIMDPNKPIWLVYRWKGVTKDQRFSDPQAARRDTRLFPSQKMDSEYIDVAQIARKLEDWISDDGNTKPLKEYDQLIEETSVTDGLPFFLQPNVDEVLMHLAFEDLDKVTY